MSSRDFSSCQLRDHALHTRTHSRHEHIVLESLYEQDRLRDVIPPSLWKFKLVLKIDASSTIPVHRAREVVAMERGCVESKFLEISLVGPISQSQSEKERNNRMATHLFVKERRLPNLVVPHDIQIHPFFRNHKFPPTARPSTIHPIQKLLHLPFIPTNKLLHNPILTA
jgi:hypothetical protein